MGAWEKFQLGWLNYEVAFAGQHSEHKLGPMETNTKQAQGLFVVLPNKPVISTSAHRLGDTTITVARAITWTTSCIRLSLSGRGNPFRKGALPDRNRLGLRLPGVFHRRRSNLDTYRDQPLHHDRSQRPELWVWDHRGLGGWVDLTANLPAGDVLLGFRYWTDANTGGSVLWLMTSRSPASRPTAPKRMQVGLRRLPVYQRHGNRYTTTTTWPSTAPTRATTHPKFGPYFLGYLAPLLLCGPFPLPGRPADQLLGYLPDRQQYRSTRAGSDPADRRPSQDLYRVDGGRWRNRIQTYDSTFTLDPTDALTNLHSERAVTRSEPAGCQDV